MPFIFIGIKAARSLFWNLKELLSQNGKDSRIKAAKIQDYINILSEYGTRIGEPYVKHIEGEIWELRSLRDRIFFVAWPYHVTR